MKKIHILMTSDATSVSETFFRKTISDFEAKGNEVIVISGKKKGTRMNAIYSGFAEPSLMTKFWKLMVFMKEHHRTADFYDKVEWELRCRSSKRRLKRSLKGEVIEFLLNEYVDTAVRASEFLSGIDVPFGICARGYDASMMLSSKAYCKTLRRLRPKFFLVVSQHLKRRLVLTGVDPNLLYVQPSDGQFSGVSNSKKDINFISIGRFVEKKCPMALVYAMEIVVQEFPNAKLVMVGDGPLWSSIRRVINKKGLSKNIELLGALSHTKTLELLNRCEVFIQHSVTSGDGDQEGFPTAISEAMLAGIPVISTIHSGITEAVVDGETGYLVQEHDFEKFGESMITLLSSSAIRVRMGENAQERARTVNPPGKRIKILYKLIQDE